MMQLAAIGAASVAFFLALLGTVVAKRLASLWGFVDTPRQDRHHRSPTPLLGGSAMVAAILMPSLLVLSLAAVWSAQGPPEWVPEGLSVHVGGVVAKAPMALGILAGAVALHVVGLIDDRRRLSPWLKLLPQLVVAVAIVTVCRIRMLEIMGEPISTLASILWIVLVTNAFNFLDNIDGLAAGVAAICAAALLAAAAASGSDTLERSISGVSASAWDGQAVSEVMRRSGFFPASDVALLVFGEKSGSFTDCISDLARLHKEEVRTLTRFIAGILPMIFTLGLGFLMALLYISLAHPYVHFMKTIVLN